MDLHFTYASFEGRIGRLHFIAALLLLAAASVAVTFVGVGLFAAHRGPVAFVVAVVMAGACAANVWATLALYAKRLHDVGVSGWGGAWILGLIYGGLFLMPFAPRIAAFVMLVSCLLALVLTFAPGDERENGWGPPPHGPVHTFAPAE